MTEPRYSWVVRNRDDEPWVLLNYRWTNREHALQDAGHWLHHYEQVKTVQVVGEEWQEIQ